MIQYQRDWNRKRCHSRPLKIFYLISLQCMVGKTIVHFLLSINELNKKIKNCKHVYDVLNYI